MHETVNQIVYRFSVVSASCNAAIPGQKVQCRRRVICVYSQRCSVICNGALQFFNNLIVKELSNICDYYTNAEDCGRYLVSLLNNLILLNFKQTKSFSIYEILTRTFSKIFRICSKRACIIYCCDASVKKSYFLLANVYVRRTSQYALALN